MRLTLPLVALQDERRVDDVPGSREVDRQARVILHGVTVHVEGEDLHVIIHLEELCDCSHEDEYHLDTAGSHRSQSAPLQRTVREILQVGRGEGAHREAPPRELDMHR